MNTKVVKENFDKIELLFDVVESSIDKNTLSNILNKSFELQKEIIEAADYSNSDDVLVTKMTQKIIDMLVWLQKQILDQEVDSIIERMEQLSLGK